MARGKKTEPETTEQVKPSEVRQVISSKKLKEVLNAKKDLRSDVQGMNSTFGDMVKRITQKTPFSKKVLGFLSVLWDMTPERLALELEDLEHGLEASGLNAKAATAPTLGLGKEEAGEDDEDPQSSNVRGFPNRGSVAAE